jgi:hypothetical protein
MEKRPFYVRHPEFTGWLIAGGLVLTVIAILRAYS